MAKLTIRANWISRGWPPDKTVRGYVDWHGDDSGQMMPATLVYSTGLEQITVATLRRARNEQSCCWAGWSLEGNHPARRLFWISRSPVPSPPVIRYAF